MIPVNTNFPERIGAALSATFPDLAPIPTVTLLKDGFRNVVVETPGGQVFKIARNWEASASFAKEVACLPALSRILPVRVPSPDWYAGRSCRFPFGVLGYPKLAGTPLARHLVTGANQKQLALGVGTFIAALHGIDFDRFPSGNLPRSDMRWFELNKARDTVLPLLRDELTESEYTTVAGWWNAYLSDERMRFFSPVIQHGDLESENILISHDCETVSCVVDFETIAIDDPALDIAAQLHLGSAFALAVLDQYQAAGGILDENFEYRVQRHWELRGFKGMRLAIHHENQREFDRLLTLLRNGPLLHDTTRRETQIWPPLRR